MVRKFMPKLSRNCICFFAFVLLGVSEAQAGSPIIDGLAGAGRSGIPRESVFLNPAAISLMQSSAMFFDYTKPRISDWNAGGRDLSVGLYDTSSSVHGGMALEKKASAVLVGGAQEYADVTTARLGFATPVGTNWLVGAAPRYVTRRAEGKDSNYVTGDVGTIFSLFTDMRAGITYENLVNKPGERPRTLAGGLNYTLGFGMSTYGDMGFATNGEHSGDKLWSLGLELGLSNDFVLRGGLYQDGIVSQRGGAWGFSWTGPRTSFDFSMRMTAHAPVQRDMTLGMTVQL